jgi:hypothetical protein
MKFPYAIVGFILVMVGGLSSLFLSMVALSKSGRTLLTSNFEIGIITWQYNPLLTGLLAAIVILGVVLFYISMRKRHKV